MLYRSGLRTRGDPPSGTAYPTLRFESVRCKVRELDLAGAAHPVYSPDYVLAICLCCPTRHGADR